ncbi:hypothetical protein Tco_1178813 [Tanacetum coccineum]
MLQRVTRWINKPKKRGLTDIYIQTIGKPKLILAVSPLRHDGLQEMVEAIEMVMAAGCGGSYRDGDGNLLR